VVLIAVGFSVQGKVKRSTAIAVVLGWFLLYKVIGAGLASM
jgi:hypothetical protein